MKSRLTFVFLFIAGLLLLAIGGAILLAPHAFHAGNGIVLGHDPNLLSEIRAPGGLLVGSAVFILIGALRPDRQSLAVMLTVLVYGSFGLAAIGLLMLRRQSDAASTESAHQLAISPDVR